MSQESLENFGAYRLAMKILDLVVSDMIESAAWLLAVPKLPLARELPTILPLPFRRGEGRGEGSQGRRGVPSPPAGGWEFIKPPLPALSSLGGGEGEATAYRRLASFIQPQCPAPLKPHPSESYA